MSRISKEKREKIMADILATIYQHTPKPLFTVNIARFLARDEEFIKKLLLELLNRKFVFKIDKNPKGIPYIRRTRWRLTDTIYQTYKKHQNI